MQPIQTNTDQTKQLLQDLITELWIEVLGLSADTLTPELNFFAAGGDSLAATLLMGKYNARKAAVANLPDAEISEFFQHPTIHRFVLAQLQKSPVKPQISTLTVPTPTSGTYPASAQQASLYFLDVFNEGSSEYNCPYAVRLQGDLSISSLQKSLALIITRHEVLRSTFHLTNAGLECRINPSPPDPLTLVDLSSTSAAPDSKETSAQRLLEQDAQAPFKLDEDVMLRALLIKLDEKHYLLQLTAHHIAVDGMSSNILIKELNKLYAEILKEKNFQLDEPDFQYREYCKTQLEWLHSCEATEQLTALKLHLANTEDMILFPLPRQKNLSFSSNGRKFSSLISKTVLSHIKTFCAGQSLTLYQYLETLFAYSLHKVSGKNRLVIGSPVSGRPQPLLDEQIGYFSNMMVLASDLSHGMSLPEFFHHNCSTILQSLRNQKLPFPVLVNALNPSRDFNSNPIFQTSFSLHTYEVETLNFTNVKVSTQRDNISQFHFDLELDIKREGSGLQLIWQYRDEIIERDFIQELSRVYERVVCNTCT